MVEPHRRDVLASDGLASALVVLDPRSRRGVEERWRKVHYDNSGGKMK